MSSPETCCSMEEPAQPEREFGKEGGRSVESWPKRKRDTKERGEEEETSCLLVRRDVNIEAQSRQQLPLHHVDVL